MKRIILFPFVSFIFLFSCRSAYFNTPNDLRNMTGTVYLINGTSVHGKLVINTNNFLGSTVKVYQEGDKKPTQFNLPDVKGYELRNDYYALKEIRGGINLGKNYSFMKRLTKDNSRIHLYENTEKYTNTGIYGSSSTYYETQYYMQFPGEQGDVVWALSSNKFVPNFNEKMSKLVADCPSLSNKIANKEDGYFYKQVSLSREKRADVLLNIIDEYNRCK